MTYQLLAKMVYQSIKQSFYVLTREIIIYINMHILEIDVNIVNAILPIQKLQ